MFPLPQCTDNGAKRNFTKEELDGCTTGEPFTAAGDGSTACASSTLATPPSLAGFTADACVTASLVIAENKIVGSDAKPGVSALIAKGQWRTKAQLTTTVLRPVSNPPAVTKDHCFARLAGYGLPFVIVRISSPGVPSTRGESGFWIAGLRLGGGCCRVCRFALPIVVSFCDEGISCQ